MLNFIKIQHPKVNRQRPPRLRRGEISFTAFLWFFLWPTAPKKERNELGRVTLKKFSPFFLAPRAQKEPKTPKKSFASAEATKASRPRPAQTFEKV